MNENNIITGKCDPNYPVMVSVVVVTYNQEKWIRQTLDLILAQETEYPFEVIIGEDMGPDGTRAICLEYAERYENVRLMSREKNLGVVGNWLDCIAHSSGKYIMNCGGDDYWHNPKKIQMQVEFMEEHPDCVVCHTDIDLLHENSGVIEHNYKAAHKTVQPQGRIQRDILAGRENISAVTICYRRSTFDTHVPVDKYIELGFPREDWPTLLIMAAYGDILYIPESTATYRVDQESITRTSDYEKIRQRYEKDKVMLEYLYTLFPEWGVFKDGPWFDGFAYHAMMMAAYRNDDYKSAHKFANQDKYSNKATKMAKTWVTFKLYRIIQQLRHRL